MLGQSILGIPEHQVGQTGLRLSYVGTRGSGLNYNLEMNKPQPSLTPFTAARRPYSQFISTVYGQRARRADLPRLRRKGSCGFRRGSASV